MDLVEQALLGYDNGHRLLASSCEMPTSALATLVATSDTAVKTGRVLTGQLLNDTQIYALCATWRAPEISRPGAVWAHVLLLDAARLADFSVEDLAHTLDGGHAASSPRPENYRMPREIRSGMSLPAADLEDLFACAQAAYASRRRTAHVASAAAAEATVLRLWASQWPELRQRFSFRIRVDSRSTVPKDVDLYVALDGPSKAPSSPQDTPWLTAWSAEIHRGQRGRVSRWFDTFGPLEPPRPASVRALGRIWALVESLDADAVAGRLTERYPDPSLGRPLKAALFACDSSWWSATEKERLVGVLSSTEDAWDLADLGLGSRLAAAIMRDEGLELLAAVPGQPPSTLANALLTAAINAPRPEMLAALVEREHDWGVAVLKGSELAHQQETWHLLDTPTVRRLLGDAQLASDSRALGSALSAGHLAAVIDVADRRALGRALGALNEQTLHKLARLPHVGRLVEAARPVDVLRLAQAGAPVTQDQRRMALKALRPKPNELWLRQAAYALANDPKALPIVFGPLHHAVTEDRLPRELWNTIGNVAPAAKDPAHRLRLLLVQRARAERWQAQAIREALRGAGPYAGQVLDDLNDDDPLTKFFKRGLKRLKRLKLL